MAGSRVLIDLNDDQLRKLAISIHAQELESLHKIHFKSHLEQLQYLNSCNDSHKTIEELLDKVKVLKSKIDDSMEESKKSIAHDVVEYALKGVSLSVQLIRSYDVRRTHLKKLNLHCDSLISRFHTLNPVTEMQIAKDLALEALTSRRAILDHAQKMQHFLPNLFTRWLKESRLSLEDLLVKYKLKLNLQKPFKELSEFEKLQVLESIVDAAKRGKSVINYAFKALGALGAAVLVFTASTMVWDIFTTEDKVQTVVRNMSGILLTQLDLSVFAASAIRSGLSVVGVEIAGAALTVAGAIVGFGIGVLIGVAIGAMLDVIFSSGSARVLTTQGLTHCYVSPMPDGIQLARIIKANNP